MPCHYVIVFTGKDMTEAISQYALSSSNGIYGE